MSPAATKGVVAGIEVRLGGQALAPTVLQKLIEVRIQENLMLPDTFLMRISDPDMKQVDSAVYEIGAEVEILLASAHEGSLQPVFKGQVTALEPEFSAGGAYVALRGYDNSHAMHRTKRTQTYQNATADDIARKVAARSGLQPGTIEAAGAPHDFIQQSNESDWEFLWRLAGAIDFEVVVVDKEMHFREAGGMADAEPVTLAWGAQLVSFRPRVTGVQQMHEVLVRGWDPSTKQVIESTATADSPSSTMGIERDGVVESLGGGTMTVADRPVMTQAEADALASSVAAHLGNAFVEADGSCHGDPRIRAGSKVKIEKVGVRFSGTYSLSAVTHVFRGAKGYETHFSVTGRSPRSLVDLMTPAAKRSWGDSVVVGVVTQNEDPEGLGRVRVKYPALGEDTEGWWARVVSISAGEGRGVMMMPIVGDEVLLAFEHGDVRRPFVLGSLFNGQSKPKELSQTDGSFALGSDKAVSVKAAEGVTIESGKTLQLISEADMKVTAQQGLTEEVQGERSLEAQGSVTVKGGASVTVESQAAVTIKAPAITIEADGVVQISGAQVMLG
ncbi:MAG TPA: VgrG-related protein [Solirubrobacteraceae bacterium]|jgi:phage protein D|nr:VgrG-related protein [Solirubrobacteraceae bacterium]